MHTKVTQKYSKIFICIIYAFFNFQNYFKNFFALSYSEKKKYTQNQKGVEQESCT